MPNIVYFAVETNSGEGFEELRAVALMLPPEEAAIVAVARSFLDWHKRHGFCAVCGHRTNIAMAGWKRACPSCNAEHFPRVDPVVIMLPSAATAASSDASTPGPPAAWRRSPDSWSPARPSTKRAPAS